MVTAARNIGPTNRTEERQQPAPQPAPKPEQKPAAAPAQDTYREKPAETYEERAVESVNPQATPPDPPPPDPNTTTAGQLARENESRTQTAEPAPEPPPPLPAKSVRTIQGVHRRMARELPALVPNRAERQQLASDVQNINALDTQKRVETATKLDELAPQASGLRAIRKELNGPNGAAVRERMKSTMEIVHGPGGAREAAELANAATGGRVSRPMGDSVERYAQAERMVAKPTSLTSAQRGRYLDHVSGSIDAAQARIKQHLDPLTSDPNSWLGADAKQMVGSIDQKIADFKAHRQDAVRDRRQMNAQVQRAQAIEKEMQSLGGRIEQRAREIKEHQATSFDRAVRADLQTTQGMIKGGYTVMEPARERARVLAEQTVPNLDATRQAYFDAKGRGAPQAEIDRALDAWHGATVDGFNYAQQSNAREIQALEGRIRNLDTAIGVTRFVRDGAFAVGAMLIPGAQGVGLASGAAAVGALGLMKTGSQLLDETPGGGSWTPGSAGRALVTNTAGLGVDAVSGAGYLKLGKEMVLATNTIQKGRLIGEAGALSMGAGTTHRLIQGEGTEAFAPKKLFVDGVIGAGTFGANAKLAPVLQQTRPIARHTANTVIGGATGGSAQVLTNLVDGRPIGENVDIATIQGAGTSLATSVAMRKQRLASEEARMPEPEYARGLKPRIQQAVDAYQKGDYQAAQQLLTDREYAARIGVRLDVKAIGVNRDPNALTPDELDAITTAARTNSMSWTDKKVEVVDAFFVPQEGATTAKTSGDVRAVAKQLTPIMLEEWMHQMQNASGKPISNLTSQYLKEKGLAWSPEHHEMDIIASFYEWGFPVDDIGTVHAYPERKAFQDWYRKRGGR
jgi:hypothetical protein